MGWEHIESMSALRNMEHVVKHVFLHEEKDVTNTVKKLYANAVRHEP